MMAYVYFVITGMVAGLCAGLFGVGGGLIIVPVLVWVFAWLGMNADVVAHVALGTSLSTIVLTSISSSLAHHAKGAVRWEIVRVMAAGLMMGSLLGAYVASFLHSAVLQVVIGVGAIIMAIKMLFFPNQEQANRPLPKPSTQLLAGFGIGGLSAIFGIGGGSLTVPFLNHGGLPMKQAVGTSAACGLPIATAGAVGFMCFANAPTGVSGTVGFVHLGAFVCISAMSVISANVGAKLAHQLPAKQLKRGFGCLLLLVGIKLMWS